MNGQRLKAGLGRERRWRRQIEKSHAINFLKTFRENVLRVTQIRKREREREREEKKEGRKKRRRKMKGMQGEINKEVRFNL